MPDAARALIILPTFNEAENIAALLRGLRDATGPVEPFDIVVVDDGSPDGTAQIVRDLMESDPRLNLIDRGKKLGLGTAYRAGFDHAAERGHQFVFTMDADFSHNPEHMPQMWAKADENDVVIGSRYIPGGGVSNWPFHRRLLSKTANMMARLMLRLKARDCTSGYRCYRVSLLSEIGLDQIKSDGYSYLSEILYRCERKGARIAESPIHFVDRRAGQSKISKREIWKAMATLVRLRFHREK